MKKSSLAILCLLAVTAVIGTALYRTRLAPVEPAERGLQRAAVGQPPSGEAELVDASAPSRRSAEGLDGASADAAVAGTGVDAPDASPLGSTAKAPLTGLIVELTGDGAAHPEAAVSDAFQVYGASSATLPGAPRVEALRLADGQLWIDTSTELPIRFVVLDAELFVRAVVPVPLDAEGRLATIELPVVRGVLASGQVQDAEGLPIAGARVRLSSWDQPDRQGSIGLEEEVLTQSDGRFQVGGVRSGEMTLRVSAKGYLGAAKPLGPRIDGAEVRDALVKLEGGGRVFGTVLFADGSPLTKGKVRLSAVGRSWDGARTQAPDDTGAFEFTGLGAGTYRVWARGKPKRSRSALHAEAVATPGQELKLVLRDGFRVEGRALDDRGEPLAKFRVSATPVGQDKGADRASEWVRDGDGSFELTGVRGGTYDIAVTSDGFGSSAPLRIQVPETSTALVLTVPRLAKVSGTVRSTAGAALAGLSMRVGGQAVTTGDDGRYAVEKVVPGALQVKVLDARGGVLRSPPYVIAPGDNRDDVDLIVAAGASIVGTLHPTKRGGIDASATIRAENSYSMSRAPIDAEGHFAFTGLRAGTYWVALSPVAGREWVDTFRDTNPIRVEVPKNTAVSVVLGDPESYGITVSGRVEDGGAPASGMLMYVYGTGVEQTFPATITRTRDEGEYELRLNEPGSYTFNVGKGQTTQARFEVEVTGEASQTFDFTLPDRVLRGRARLADGTPVAGRMYVLVHESAPALSKQAGALQFARTRGDGSFEFPGLPPGEYRLHTGNYVAGHDTDGLLIVERVEVKADGESADLDLVIPSGAIVTTKAVDAAGRPLADRAVRLLNPSGYPCVIYDTRRTDANGEMRWTGVGPGAWTAVVVDGAGAQVGSSDFRVGAGEVTSVTVSCGT